MYFLKLSQKQSGLCNQLNSLLSTICVCINREKMIVVDKFLQEIHTNYYLPISNVINLEKTNLFLEKFNIAIIDGNFTDHLKILRATYENNNKFIDITENIVKYFLKNNTFIIKKNTNLNFILGSDDLDSQLKINFMLNNYNTFNMVFKVEKSYLVNDINIDFSDKKYIWAPCWDLIDNPTFKTTTTDIYKNLIFGDGFIHLSNQFIQTLHKTPTTNVNIIHLRLEKDAIAFWSKQNKLNQNDFLTKLTNKYIKIITEFINKTDKTIILTYCTNNAVIDFLTQNNYDFYFHKKFKKDNRELNALIDLINSKHCNNVFIGVGGSTFSHTITKLINPKITVFFDLNNIMLD